MAAALDALRRGEPYRRWLLVFDNADQPEELNDLILRGPGDVLITSRNHRWQSVVEAVPLDVLSRAESLEFLEKRAPRAFIRADAEALAEELGDLPLALGQAGAMLAETGMPPQEYLRLLGEHVTGIMAEGRPYDYPMPMASAWRRSVSSVQQEVPLALELMRCCAFFGPEAIPHDLFRGSPTVGAGLGGLIADPIVLARALRELGRFGLVGIDGRGISIHRLVQALVRDELDAKEQDACRQQVHALLAASLQKDPGDVDWWGFYRELVPHVRAPVVELERSQDPGVRTAVLNVLDFLRLSGDLAACRSLAEEVVAQWGGDSGPDAPDVLGAQLVLGQALRELGHYRKARESSEAALHRAGEAVGERSDLALTLRNAVGADLRACGEFAAALRLDEETWHLHEEEFGPDHPRTLRSMSDLASDYELACDYGAARQLYMKAFVLQHEPHSGVPLVEVLVTWTRLARALGLAGSYAEAQDMCEEVVDFGREKLGPEHYQTLRTTREFCVAMRRKGTRRDEALSLAREVHANFARLFGDDHPDTLAATISVTNTLRVTEQADQVLKMAEDTADRGYLLYGPDHPYRHGCAGNLALLRRLAGDPAGAASLNESALASLDATLGRDHRLSLTVAANLAGDLAALGEVAKARTLGEDTLARLRSLLGDNHPMTLGCSANLALDLRACGVDDDAAQMAADTLTRFAQTLGDEHADAKAAAAGTRLDFDFDPPSA